MLIDEKGSFPSLEKDDSAKQNWKFVSVVQFVNLFKSTLSIDSVASIDFENSLRNPDVDPLCLNILLKLIMKKSLYKPMTKIGENFDQKQLHEMLTKKMDYFYKLYLRQLKKQYPDIQNVNELIQTDINDSNHYNQEKFSLSSQNLQNKVYWDLDLQTLMILDFFRGFDGRNPFIKGLNKDINLNSNNLDNLIQDVEIPDEDKKPDESSIRVNKPLDISGVEQGEEKKEENLLDYYNTFQELPLNVKIEVLYFFCNFAMSFSGRSHLYRDEIVKSSKEVKEGLRNGDKTDLKDPGAKDNSSSQNPGNSNSLVISGDIKKHKRATFLGVDCEGNSYYSVFCNQDCRIYKDKKTKDLTSEFTLEVKNYEDLEKLMSRLENSRNSNEGTLLKKIKEYLLKYKEYDDHEKLREVNFIRKIQQQKALKLAHSKDDKRSHTAELLALMNVSGHVVTRHQLNQISKNANNKMSLMSGKPVQKIIKPPVLTDEQRRQHKAEQDKLDRERRMEKRKQKMEQSMLKEEFREQFPNEKLDKNSKAIGRKRMRSKKKRGNYSEEEMEESNEESEEGERTENLDLYSDKDEENGDDAISFEKGEKKMKTMFRIKSSASHELELEENYEGVSESKDFENTNPNDIILEGNLIYRYSNDQIELDGFWFMSQDNMKERLSYLFMHGTEFFECELNPEDITDNVLCTNDYSAFTTKLKICSANIFECILINKTKVFNAVLTYLSGDYAGYFMYYGKTIEDRFNLNLSLQDSLIKVNGEGMNNLGSYKVIGYMNFYKSKDELLQKNDIELESIKLAEFRLTKIYTAFNPNENYRVIKSFQHRRKKIDEDIF